MQRKIRIYDASLRDGTQGEGVSFSESGRIRFAHVLDEFGIDFIEGGYPGSNPTDRNFFSEMKKSSLRNAQLVAFGMACRPGIEPDRDPALRALLEAETEWVTIYGKSYPSHVEKVLGLKWRDYFPLLAQTVRFLHREGRKVIFDAEHFFDGWRSAPEDVAQMLEQLFAEAPEYLTLCDTNGGTLPGEIGSFTAAVAAMKSGVPLGIHTHNDCGLAVANTLAALENGAEMAQGCVNGFGERIGNADLTSIIPILELKCPQFTCIGPERLKMLSILSKTADELTNRRPDPCRPFVGSSAFSHKAGTHVNAVAKDPSSFEQIDPAAVGNERHVLVSELAGKTNILIKSRELGEPLDHLDKTGLEKILNEIKERESVGYSYESVDGSLKILLQKALHRYSPKFELDGFRVIVEKRGRDVPCISEATIKIKVGDRASLSAGEGGGPVDALNQALRTALRPFYPEIDQMSLSDYRVRILDPQQAAKATTRVVIESSDSKQQWSTIGVSENIVEASWQAMLESLEYFLNNR